MQEQINSLQATVQGLKSEISDLQKILLSLRQQVIDSANRYVATCPSCQAHYDMLAHHYSIGLFDNMVYVKCPNCNKTLPVQGGADGKVQTALDQTS